MARPGELERSWKKNAVMRLLAAGERTPGSIGLEMGVSREAVMQFRDRHLDEIADLKERLKDEWAGLWVAQKANRLAVYQESIERIGKALDELTAVDEDGKLTTVQAKLLRQVAEEVGDLRNDINVNGKVLHHILEGVDTAALT